MTRQTKLGETHGGQRTDDHDRRNEGVHALATEDVRDPPEHEGAHNGAEKSRTGHPACFDGTEVPLNRDDGSDGSNDEQVVGIGEKPHAGDEHRPTVKLASRCLVEKVADHDRREPFGDVLRLAKQHVQLSIRRVLVPAPEIHA